MKKILFATLLTGSISVAFSQGNIKHGDWMLGGDGSFTSEKSGSYKQTTLRLSPDAGYFFIDNLAGGLRVDLSHANWPGNAKSTNFIVAPFVRFYFLPSAQKVNIFADASFGLGQHKQTGITETKYSMNQYAVKAGPSIFLTPATALEITLGYNSSKVEGDPNRSNDVGVTIGFQIHLPGTFKK